VEMLVSRQDNFEPLECDEEPVVLRVWYDHRGRRQVMLPAGVVEHSFVSATLCCSLNNLSDFGWPSKYLMSRERLANRGLGSWVQKRRGKISKPEESIAATRAISSQAKLTLEGQTVHSLHRWRSSFCNGVGL
jgi:hypothetical protein